MVIIGITYVNNNFYSLKLIENQHSKVMKLCCLETMIRTLLATLLTDGLMDSFHLNLVHPKSATVTVFRARTWEEGFISTS